MVFIEMKKPDDANKASSGSVRDNEQRTVPVLPATSQDEE